MKEDLKEIFTDAGIAIFFIIAITTAVYFWIELLKLFS